jgi:Condensation domain
MFDGISNDKMAVRFAGAEAATEPLTWGQKAILQDMQESGNQFSMQGRINLPVGGTLEDAAARVNGMLVRHASLRMRLSSGHDGHPCQQVAGSGQFDLDIATFPDDADRADVARYRDHLWTNWPLERFDFHRDWPLRVAVLRHRGACLHLVWVMSHLAADGGGILLLLADLLSDETGTAKDPRHPSVLDIARSEQTSKLRQLSSRTMRHWESQLLHIPPQTFGAAAGQNIQAGQRYSQARFSSAAAFLAMLAISRRTGTDASRVTLAVIATAIGRATGLSPLTIKVMVNNRFRPGMAAVIAPIAQNSVVTVDVASTSIDDVLAQTRAAALTAGMRAYYDPDDLSEVTARLDAERGYPARITCRVNDQRAMIMRSDAEADLEVTPEQVSRRLEETSLTWLGHRENMHEQVLILIENRPDVVSLHMMWDLSCLTNDQVEALLRSVEEVAVEAAFDPDAPTKVACSEGKGR